MSKMPIDCQQRRIASRARAVLHGRVNTDRWLYREVYDDPDGVDCTLELSEKNRWHGDVINGQIRGTTRLRRLSGGDLSFAMETRDLRAAMRYAGAYVLFLVEVKSGEVYFLPVQDYVLSDRGVQKKLLGRQKRVNVRIPAENLLLDDDAALRRIAKKRYGGETQQPVSGMLDSQLSLF